MFNVGDYVTIVRGGRCKELTGQIIKFRANKFTRLPHQLTDKPNLDALIQIGSKKWVWRDVYYLDLLLRSHTS